jgi:hypothetical protein
MVSHALNTEDSYECDGIQAGKTAFNIFGMAYT